MWPRKAAQLSSLGEFDLTPDLPPPLAPQWIRKGGTLDHSPDDDSSPESWTPRHIKQQRERERQVLNEMELAAGAMTDAQFAEFTKRARGDR